MRWPALQEGQERRKRIHSPLLRERGPAVIGLKPLHVRAELPGMCSTYVAERVCYLEEIMEQISGSRGAVPNSRQGDIGGGPRGDRSAGKINPSKPASGKEVQRVILYIERSCRGAGERAIERKAKLIERGGRKDVRFTRNVVLVQYIPPPRRRAEDQDRRFSSRKGQRPCASTSCLSPTG